LDDHECGEAKNIKPLGVGYHYVVPIWQSFILGNIERHLHTPCQPSEHSHEHEQHQKHGPYGLNARPADHEPTNLTHALSKLGAENMIYYLLACSSGCPTPHYYAREDTVAKMRLSDIPLYAFLIIC
jgi:hypothetical protein